MITTTTQNFDWGFNTLSDPRLEAMLTAAKEFSSAMFLGETPHWLTFAGNSGTGKTHLAKAITRYWRRHAGWTIQHGRGGDFRTLRDSSFVSWVKFMGRQRAGEFDEMKSLCAVPFLALDDIGAERDINDFAKDRMHELLSSRLGKWTVITSNLFLSQIATQIDTRVSSRLIRGGSKVIQVETSDYNLRPKTT